MNIVNSVGKNHSGELNSNVPLNPPETIPNNSFVHVSALFHGSFPNTINVIMQAIRYGIIKDRTFERSSSRMGDVVLKYPLSKKKSGI